jgi:hypothetical protein
MSGRTRPAPCRRAGADRVTIAALIVEIDAVRGRASVVPGFMPHGRFDAGDRLLAVPVEVDVSDVGGGDEFAFGTASGCSRTRSRSAFGRARRRIIPLTAIMAVWKCWSWGVPRVTRG